MSIHVQIATSFLSPSRRPTIELSFQLGTTRLEIVARFDVVRVRRAR